MKTKSINDKVKDLYRHLSKKDQELVFSSEEAFFRMLDEKDVDYYPCYQDNRLASVMLVFHLSMDCIISFTHPDHRRRGLQRKLLRQVKDAYTGKKLYVKVKNDNTDGWKKFWGDEGFELVEENDDFIRLVRKG